MERETALLAQIESLERSSRSEADQRLTEVFRDGIVTREEAERLFELHPRMSATSAGWDARFVEAICDFLLKVEPPVGWISDDEADWLVAEIEARAPALPSEAELELLLTALRLASGAPPRLGRYALGLACRMITAKGFAEEADVETVRRAIYAPASDGGLWVTREEAGMLFRTNDAVAHARNHDSWNDLFARCIGNHLLAAAHPDPMSEGEALRRETWLKSTGGGVFAGFGNAFGQGWFDRVLHDPERAQRARTAARQSAQQKAEMLTEDETSWFLRRLGWDKSISPAERALIGFLKAEAPGFTDGLVAGL